MGATDTNAPVADDTMGWMSGSLGIVSASMLSSASDNGIEPSSSDVADSADDDGVVVSGTAASLRRRLQTRGASGGTGSTGTSVGTTTVRADTDQVSVTSINATTALHGVTLQRLQVTMADRLVSTLSAIAIVLTLQYLLLGW